VGGLLLLAAAGCGGGGSTKPAERHLVYVRGDSVSNATVWIADANGAHPRRLAHGDVAVLSPDGRTVAVTLRGKGISLVSSDSGHERRLTARPLHPRTWSPDGQTLFATAETSRAVTALVAIDSDSGKVHTIATGSLYGFDVSPKGDRLVYSRAPEATTAGICGDQFDLYVAKLDGSSPRQITHDGLSAFPVWGPKAIAFSHFPGAGTVQDCVAPGIWTVKDDGSGVRHVVSRTPDAITLLGYYGYQPLAWLNDRLVLVGLRSDAGSQGAVLDTQTGKLRRLNHYVDEASSDGRFSVGSGGDQDLNVSIVRLSDGRRVFLSKGSCCPDWNR
jgi:hypothetical protein